MEWYVEQQSEYERHSHALPEILFRGRTAYQDVLLARNPVYGKILFLDGDIQSAQADERAYHEALVHPALIALPHSPRRVLILGGGEGATLREVLRYHSVERVVMVDLDGELVEMCKQQMPEWHQGCFADPRLELRHEDARAYLDRCSEKFDACIHDLPQPLVESPLRLLFTRECWQRVQACLAPGGVLCLESMHVKYSLNALHLLVRRTVESVFRHVRTAKAFIPSFATEWGYVLAGDETVPGALTPQEVDDRIEDRIGEELEYYRGETHPGYFAMTRQYRRELARENRVLEDAVPLPELHATTLT